MRERVAAVEKMIFETAERDGRDVTIGLPKDPGATAGDTVKTQHAGLVRRALLFVLFDQNEESFNAFFLLHQLQKLVMSES